MRYRPEIDGLRAVAVLPVILFHAGLGIFGGGFVGVDVFFVISGYLITTILIEDLAGGRFSLLAFYERRARRILPALFAVMLCCLPLAWAWMTPGQLRDFSESLVAVSLFVSNVLFWLESGYFAAAAEEKPLLHTWSLAVEEQYYLLFPVFLWLVWRFGTRAVVWLIAGIAGLSLGLAEWGWRHEPTASFYLSPTRAWELLAGALAAFAVRARGVEAREAPALAGLAAIGLAILAYGPDTPFPSLYTVLPVGGTVLVVLYAAPGTRAARLLSLPPLVGIGLISYSAYLWHQPLFAFARIRSVGDLSPWLLTGLAGLSLGLAYLSWRFVERPFRDRAQVSRRAIVAASVAGMAGFVALGQWGAMRDGFPERLPPGMLAYHRFFENHAPDWRYYRQRISGPYRDSCNFYDVDRHFAGRPTEVPRTRLAADCTVPAPGTTRRLLIWGDSHAQQFSPGLSAALGPDWAILQVASSGCVPALADASGPDDYCQVSNRTAMATVRAAAPQAVLLAQEIDHDPAQLAALARWLAGQGVAQVVVMGPVPRWNPPLHEMMLGLWPDLPRRSWHGVERQYLKVDARLRDALGGIDGLTYVSVFDLLCAPAGCLVSLDGDFTEGLTTYDYGHLTPAASAWVAEAMLARHAPFGPLPE